MQWGEREGAFIEPLEPKDGGDEARPQPEPVADSPILKLVAVVDPAPLGRFVNEQDLIQPVPSYTRSKIRLAFKEQEVNSKTTWLSKLFRGGSSEGFRVVAEGDASGGESPDMGPARSQDPSAHPPESALGLDPDVQSLVNRIKPQGGFTVSPRVEEYKAKAEAAAFSTAPIQDGPRVPFVERRSGSREAEPGKSSMQHPFTAVTASALEERPAEDAPEAEWAPGRFAYAEPDHEPLPPHSPAGWTPAAEDWLRTLRSSSLEATEEPFAAPERDAPVEWTPSYLAEPVHVGEKTEAAPLAEWTPSAWTEPAMPPAPAARPRPLRPLTFQQLAGLEPIPAPIPAPIPLSIPSPADAIRRAQPDTAQVAAAVVVRRIEPIVPAFEPHPEGYLAARRPVAHEPEPVALEPAPQPQPDFQPEPAPEIAAFAQPDVWDAAGVWSANEPVSAPPQARPKPAAADEEPAYSFARRESQPDSAWDRLAQPVHAPTQVPVHALDSDEPWEWLSAPPTEVPANTVIAPNPEAWAHQFGRRSTDRVGPGGKPLAPGLTRRWALLSQFEPDLSDPSPAPRRRSTDFPSRNADGDRDFNG